MKKRIDDMAACGLICSRNTCDIMQATEDKEVAKQISEWFKINLNKDIAPDQIHCKGCHGPHDSHWSADCWIHKCCVEKNGLHNCSECKDFSCDELVKWSESSRRYTCALERLKSLIER